MTAEEDEEELPWQRVNSTSASAAEMLTSSVSGGVRGLLGVRAQGSTGY